MTVAIRANQTHPTLLHSVWSETEMKDDMNAVDHRIMAVLEKKKTDGQAWSRRVAVKAEAEASKSSDPIMSVREYLTMPKTQAEVFLNLWVERQQDAQRASMQAQGLRLKATLAVADGSEMNHPTE